jgi:hypothetical protein
MPACRLGCYLGYIRQFLGDKRAAIHQRSKDVCWTRVADKRRDFSATFKLSDAISQL